MPYSCSLEEKFDELNAWFNQKWAEDESRQETYAIFGNGTRRKLEDWEIEQALKMTDKAQRWRPWLRRIRASRPHELSADLERLMLERAPLPSALRTPHLAFRTSMQPHFNAAALAESSGNRSTRVGVG